MAGLQIRVSLALDDLKLCRKFLVRLLKRFGLELGFFRNLLALILNPLRQLLVIGLKMSDTLLPILGRLLLLLGSDSLQIVLLFFKSTLDFALFQFQAKLLII